MSLASAPRKTLWRSEKWISRRERNWTKRLRAKTVTELRLFSHTLALLHTPDGSNAGRSNIRHSTLRNAQEISLTGRFTASSMLCFSCVDVFTGFSFENIKCKQKQRKIGNRRMNHQRRMGWKRAKKLSDDVAPFSTWKISRKRAAHRMRWIAMFCHFCSALFTFLLWFGSAPKWKKSEPHAISNFTPAKFFSAD